jgi:CheY-like chemotaxis protein
MKDLGTHEALTDHRLQMPIRDGYSATHAIRTEFINEPNVRNVPIIAMTASAIQGDREKCQQAGMDVSPTSLSTLRRC